MRHADSHTVWPTLAGLGVSIVACALLIGVACTRSANLPLFSVRSNGTEALVTGQGYCGHERDIAWHCVGRAYTGGSNASVPTTVASTAEAIRSTPNALIAAPYIVVTGAVLFSVAFIVVYFRRKKRRAGRSARAGMFSTRGANLLALLLVVGLVVMHAIMLIFSLIVLVRAKAAGSVHVKIGLAILIINFVLSVTATTMVALTFRLYTFNRDQNRLPTEAARRIARDLSMSGDGTQTAQSRTAQSGEALSDVQFFSGAVVQSPKADVLGDPQPSAPSPPLFEQHTIAKEIAAMPADALLHPRTPPMPPRSHFSDASEELDGPVRRLLNRARRPGV